VHDVVVPLFHDLPKATNSGAVPAHGTVRDRDRVLQPWDGYGQVRRSGHLDLESIDPVKALHHLGHVPGYAACGPTEDL
jgi:hypothetical protein